MSHWETRHLDLSLFRTWLAEKVQVRSGAERLVENPVSWPILGLKP